MKKIHSLIAMFSPLVLLLVFAGGCDIHISNWAQTKFKKIVHQQSPMEPGSTLKVGTSSGSITITGADVTDCNMVADITVRAPSETEAREITEKVRIILESSGKTLTIRADKPHVRSNRSISISYNIIVPLQTIVQCNSSYGSIKLSNINGNVSGRTSSGSITAENIEGSADLNTSYGSVTCRNISSDNIVIKSSSGTISAEELEGSTNIYTSYGSIHCRDISGGDAVLKTSSGKIELSKASVGNCDADTSYGSIVVEDFKGDFIKLHSDSGGINTTDTSIKTADISTSYGHIICRQIMTQELTARSGSGGINIVCSDSTPSEMKAEVVTSYGSIDFTTPPEFSGEVELGTSYGSINTELPITITGQVNKRILAGTIGSGHGRIYLRTSSGSIKLR